MDLSTNFANLRKQVAGLSLIALVAGMLATGVATAQTTNVYTDVPADAWFTPYVNGLVDAGILDTTKDTYRPGDKVQRDEMAKLAFMVSGLPLETATAAPFNDVSLDDWAVNYIYTLQKNNIVSGDKDANGVPTGFFRPADSLNRAEASKMLVNAAQMAEDLTGAPHFPDVTSSDWFYNYVETLYNHGVIAGYPDGTFKPANDVVRSEVAKMVYLSMNPVTAGFKLDSAAAASSTKVELIFSMNVDEATAEDVDNYMIEESDGTELAVTDAQVVAADTVHLTTATQTEGKVYYVTAKNVLSEAGDEMSNNDSMSFYGYGTDVTGGSLEVTLSTQTPVAGSVPNGATGVVFSCWDFSAGADDVTVKSLAVTRTGAGNENAFSDLYLYRGAERLTTGRSINSETQKVEFNNINQEVLAGKTMKLCVVGDIAVGTAAAGQVQAFEIRSMDDVETNSSDFSGAFPLRGADQLITTATVGELTVSKNGVLSEVNVGQKDAKIAQFEISVGPQEAAELERLALYVRGTVSRGDLENLKLWSLSGEELASVDGVNDNDLAVFDLEDGFNIESGDSRVFYVTADIAGGRNGENVKTYLDETTDVFVVGKDYGYGLRVNIDNYNGDTGKFSLVNVKGADFTIAFNGPSASDIAVNQDEARCLDLTLTNAAGTDVEMRDWKVNIENVGGTSLHDGVTANFTQIKMAKLNEDGSIGSTILGSSELDVAESNNNQPVTLRGNASLASGESMDVSIVFDVANNLALDGENVRCTLIAPTGNDQIKDENNDSLGTENITPNVDITGNTMTVVKSAMTVSASGVLGDETYTRGTNGAELLALSFEAGSTSDIDLSSIGLQVTTDGEAPNNLINSVSLYEDDVLVDGPNNIANVVAPDGDILFTDLGVTIPANSSKILTVKANVDSSLIGTHQLQLFVTSILATDNNGSTITVDYSNINAAVDAPEMTLLQSVNVTPTPLTVSSAQSLVTTGASSPTALKFAMKTDNGTAKLDNFKVAVDGTASMATLSLYKGDSCTEPVLSAQNVSVINGVASFKNAAVNLSTTDTLLCVKAKATELDPTDTDPTDYMLSLLSIGKLTDSSGNTVNADVMGTLTADVTDVAVVLDVTAVTEDFLTGTFITVDNEVMQLTADSLTGDTTLDVDRGMLGTTAVAHLTDANVRGTTIQGADTFEVFSSAPVNVVLEDTNDATSIDSGVAYPKKKVGSIILDVEGGSVNLQGFAVTVSADYTCSMKYGADPEIAEGAGVVDFAGKYLPEGEHTIDVYCSKLAGVGPANALSIDNIDFDSDTGINALKTITSITRAVTNDFNF